jgi:hypothetical protein
VLEERRRKRDNDMRKTRVAWWRDGNWRQRTTEMKTSTVLGTRKELIRERTIGRWVIRHTRKNKGE